MQDLSDNALAQGLRAHLIEAERRAAERGHALIAALLGAAHLILKRAGDVAVADPDIEVSPMSIGGDK